MSAVQIASFVLMVVLAGLYAMRRRGRIQDDTHRN
jgi:hypothetical protein